MPQETGAAEVRRRRFTKIRAILAGGLVLGIGAAVTLATWNDSEYANGTFSTSTFGIVGSTDGTAFTDHPSGSPATLAFSTEAGGLSPGVSTYALFAVQTTGDTDVAGTVSVGDPTFTPPTGLGADLTAAVKVISGTTCDATTFGDGTDVPAAGAPIGASGGTVNFCLQVTLKSDADAADQGQTASATWVFTGESDS